MFYERVAWVLDWLMSDAELLELIQLSVLGLLIRVVSLLYEIFCYGIWSTDGFRIMAETRIFLLTVLGSCLNGIYAINVTELAQEA